MAQAHRNTEEVVLEETDGGGTRKIVKRLKKKKKKIENIENDKKIIVEKEKDNSFDIYEASIANDIYANKYYMKSAINDYMSKKDKRQDSENVRQFKKKIDKEMAYYERFHESPSFFAEYDANIILDPNERQMGSKYNVDSSEYINQTLDMLQTDKRSTIRLYHEMMSDEEYKYNNEDIIQSNANYLHLGDKESLKHKIWKNIKGENTGPSQRTELDANIFLSLNDNRRSKEYDMNSHDWVQRQYFEQNEIFEKFQTEYDKVPHDLKGHVGDEYMKYVNAQMKAKMEMNRNFEIEMNNEKNNEMNNENNNGNKNENNSVKSDSSENGDWWKDSFVEYQMPHQTLHGGVTSNDPEIDLPTNAFYLKSTATLDNWNIMKGKFRDNMKPGSTAWNEIAFRSEFERKQMNYWPQSFKTWFQRSETELLNSHAFRGVMLEYTSFDEWWRLGELRWNRKLFFPYIRMLQWSIAPLLGIYMFYRLNSRAGSPVQNLDEWEKEYKKWKYVLRTGDADEDYTLMYHENKLYTKLQPATVKKALSVEDLESIQQRTIHGQVDSIRMQMSGMKKSNAEPIDPY